MKKQRFNYTKEKSAYLKAAYIENPFPASELVKELVPLLVDYFESMLLYTEDKIKIFFHNGQKFELTVYEV